LRACLIAEKLFAMTTDIFLGIFAGSLDGLKKLMADVPDARLAEQPAGIRNHPAWTLTHLCAANDMALSLMGEPTHGPKEWGEIAKPGSMPQADRAIYPPLATLMQTLEVQHKAFDAAVRAAPPEKFAEPTPEWLRNFAPTIGHVVAYMLTVHEHNHLGQLQAWKRAAGLAKA
jgi:hypothetical protein